MTSTSLPLACVTGAIPADQRAGHFDLIRRLFGGALSREPIVAGYAFRFGPDAFEEVGRFVANERRCCPFLDFDIRVPAGGKDLILTLSGPEGTREFLDAELPARSS